jgi:hypothetical protein
LFLYSFVKCIQWATLGGRASKGGYAVYEDGTGGVWVRKSEGWKQWWRRVSGEQKEFEIEEVDNGTPKWGFFWWNKSANSEAEERPLLD